MEQFDVNDMEKLKNPDIQYWPEVRWWLAEGFHTDQTLKSDIKRLWETGFGAVEFLAMEEPGADSKLYGWGSEEWVHDSHVIVEETTKRGMGVSMTSGTNWSNANLVTITPDDRAAAQELDYEVETLKSGTSRSGSVLESKLVVPGVTKQYMEAVVAIRMTGEKNGQICLDKDSAIVLTQNVKNGQLSWTAPEDGDYLLFYFWIHGTGQTAEPAYKTSYTINYIDRYGVEAFKEYWDNVVLTSDLKEDLNRNNRGMMYMDSLELSTFGKGGQFWGFHFLDEFKSRRGYDLTPYLPFILKESGMMQAVYNYFYDSGDEEFTKKLHNDVYQTMTDLYMENMLRPMQEWLHTHNMSLRAEISYGLPFEISQPGKYVDGIETESLEFASQIESYRNLAGPAHLYQRIYSSETGATLHNYMLGIDFYTQIIYTQFAAGVTKTVLHGYSSISGAEDSTYWPGHEGMWPIFSERFGPRQPAFCHYKDWTAMLARYQMILRQGKPRMDLGILRLDYYFNNLIFSLANNSTEEKFYADDYMRANKGIYWKDMSLQNAGYTWDYFAPQILEENFVEYDEGVVMPEGPGYKALIIYQDVLPVSTAKKLLSMAEKGLPIIFVNGVTETIRCGVDATYKKAASMTPFHDGEDENLRSLIEKIKVLPNVRETDSQEEVLDILKEMNIMPYVAYGENNKNILTHMQEDEGKRYVFVYNMKYTDQEAFAFELKLEGKGRLYKVDCWNAKIEERGDYRYENGYTCFDVVLAPGEAALYALDTNAEEVRHAIWTNAGALTVENGLFTAKAEKSGTYEAKYSDGTKNAVTVTVPEAENLKKWNLEVEDWNEGDKKEIVEDRGLGIITKEVYYETKKTRIQAGEVELKPWKEIQAVGPEVSGIGYYTTKVNIPEQWDDTMGAFLKIGSVNMQSAAVYVNGVKANALDMEALTVDITELLKAGENELMVEVTSTLNNRLIARGYFEMGRKISIDVADNASNATGEVPNDMFNIPYSVRDYGMVGETRLIYYRKVSL